MICQHQLMEWMSEFSFDRVDEEADLRGRRLNARFRSRGVRVVGIDEIASEAIIEVFAAVSVLPLPAASRSISVGDEGAGLVFFRG